MQKVHFRLTSVVQKRCCLISPMYDIIVLEKLCFLPFTRKREFGVFKSPLWGPLSGDLFFWCPKRPFSCGRKAKNTLIRVDGALNSCSQMLRLYRYDANESKINEQNISSARASRLFVFCFVFRCHDLKLPNATFCGGPRKRGDEILLLDPDAALRIQIQEISSTFFNLKNVT